MEMRYFWLLDQEAQKMFQFLYQPGAENLADYPSKAHTAPHHRLMRLLYTHQHNSPLFLRAKQPSARRGCVEKAEDTYVHAIHKHLLPTYRTPTPTRIRPLVSPAG